MYENTNRRIKKYKIYKLKFFYKKFYKNDSRTLMVKKKWVERSIYIKTIFGGKKQTGRRMEQIFWLTPTIVPETKLYRT